jgi:hypothetical protein
VRYLWDLYDAVEEPPPNFLDDYNYTYAWLANTVKLWESGTGEGKIDEPWNAAKTSVDDDKGRSGEDYLDLVDDPRPVGAYLTNCSPGDDGIP